MISKPTFLFFLFSIAIIGKIQAQQSDTVRAKAPYGGVMLDLAPVGFYELNLSEKILFVGRLGTAIGYTSSYGFQVDPTARVSLRWLLSPAKRGAANFNPGWYAELAVPVVFRTWSKRDYGNYYGLVLGGYRGVIGKKFILEGSAGFGLKSYFKSITDINSKIVPSLNIVVGYVLFSTK